MGGTNFIPVVSQVKSLVQVINGDEEGARKTQEQFIRTGIVASQVNSLVHSIQESVKTVAYDSVNVTISKFYKKNRHKFSENSELRPLHNPISILNFIKQSPEGQSVLRESLKRMKQESIKTEDPQLLYNISTFQDELALYQEAIITINRTLKSLKVDLDLLDSSDDLAFLKIVKSLDDFQRDCLHMREKLTLSLTLTSPGPPDDCIDWKIHRRSCNDLNVPDFLTNYVKKGHPVIITDLLHKLTDKVWNLDFIKAMAGEKKVVLKKHNKYSTEWAKLESIQDETLVKDFLIEDFDSNDQTKSPDELRYLFDWSLPLFCPELDQHFKIPEYFRHDFLKKTSPDSMYHKSWPSLFVAPKGIKSDLHIDAFSSHFWMFLFTGQKKWTFLHPASIPSLKPRFPSGLDPVFYDVDVEKDGDFLRSLKPVEIVLGPNELLFVPKNCPHFVENLSQSIAVSGNFVDESNVRFVGKHLRRNALVDPRAGDLLEEFIVKNLLKNHD